MKCKCCGKNNARWRDPETKEPWHKKCHGKIKKIARGVSKFSIDTPWHWDSVYRQYPGK